MAYGGHGFSFSLDDATPAERRILLDILASQKKREESAMKGK